MYYKINLFDKIKNWIVPYNYTSCKFLLYDRVLLWLILSLICIGFVMITSASIPIGNKLFNDHFYFVKRDIIYLIFSFIFVLFILNIPISFWQKKSSSMLILNVLMLLLVLITSNSINGALRWIIIGPLHIQPTEILKLILLCYLSDYITRKIIKIRISFWNFCKPIIIILIISAIILPQPDLGTIIILFVTTLSMLFLAGSNLKHFLFILILGIIIIILLIIMVPYRIKRIFSFLDPWKDPFGSGYQLIQSLIAFGRGKFWGQGLGNSIQKLEYLPEAHTDFIFSILSEEIGYFGVFITLLLIFSISLRAMLIGRRALKNNHCFSGFLSCSIGIWFTMQVFINVGVVSGLLPTKGLTLPLISYGGSSFLVMLITFAILIRIDFEERLFAIQVFQ